MNAPINAPIDVKDKLSAQTKWQGFHWTFFIDVQGLILSLKSFEQSFNNQQLDQAAADLRCTAALLKASGAAMKLAGNFTADEYENDVRVSMMPPHVQSDNFSGLMSWEHACLIKLWQQLSPTFGKLPQQISSAHTEFVEAFVDMISAHRGVCNKFVGDETSLRSSDPAISVLEKLLIHRLRMIDPNNRFQGGCPFSGSRDKPSDDQGLSS
ncbi:MAG: hypothetical protein MI976_06130 [Pseudomonadales bacterium]|nr:hypothetical protein [Pseudomonadales bacterium]